MSDEQIPYQQTVSQRVFGTNQIMAAALAVLMEKASMEHMTINNDLGEWLILKCDQSVHIEFIGKHTH